MGAQADGHTVVDVAPFRVVVETLDRRHARLHVGHGFGEGGEDHGALDGERTAGPARQPAERGGQLRVVQRGVAHRVLASCCAGLKARSRLTTKWTRSAIWPANMESQTWRRTVRLNDSS